MLCWLLQEGGEGQTTAYGADFTLSFLFTARETKPRLELMQTIKGLDLHITLGREPVSQLHLPPKSIIVLYYHEEAAEDT